MKNTSQSEGKVAEVAINNRHSLNPYNSCNQTAQLEASNNSDDTELNTPRPKRRRLDDHPSQIAQLEASNNSDDPELNTPRPKRHQFENHPSQITQLEASNNLGDAELNSRFDNDQIAELEASNNLGDAELNSRFENDQIAELEASNASDDTELNIPQPKRHRFQNPDQITQQEDQNHSNDPEPKQRDSIPLGPTCDNQVTRILSQLEILNTNLEKIGSTTENQIYDLKNEVEDLNKMFSLKETQLEAIEREMVGMLEQKADECREELKEMAADWKDELERMAGNWKDELLESISNRNPSRVSLQWRNR